MGYEGVDVSEHQGLLGPEWFGQWDYAILRAFNENGVRDRVIGASWAAAEGRTRRGIYGWPIPGGDNYALGQQLVREFPGAEAGYWADREVSGRGLASPTEVGEYMRGIFDAGGTGGFYSNIGECPRTPWLDTLMWWMADYGPNNGARYDPFAQPPVPARPFTIHQYTSAGGLDRNYSETIDWAGSGAPPSQQTPARSDMDAIVAPMVDGTSTCIVKSGSQILYDLTGPQLGGDFGILPNHPDIGYALNGSGDPRNAIPIRDVEYDAIDEARLVWFLAKNPPQPGDPDKPISDYTDAELKAEVDKRVAAGAMTLTGVLADV